MLFCNSLVSFQVEFPSKPTVSKEGKEFMRKLLMGRHELRPDVLNAWSDDYLQVSGRRESNEKGERENMRMQKKTRMKNEEEENEKSGGEKKLCFFFFCSTVEGEGNRK